MAELDYSKHQERLQEHVAAAAACVTRLDHHLRNAAGEAAVLPGCEALARLLDSAVNRLANVQAAVQHARQSNGVAG